MDIEIQGAVHDAADHTDHIVVTNSAQLKLTNSFSFSTGIPDDFAAEEHDTRLGRSSNTKQFEKVFEIAVVIVTQMYGSSEMQKNISLGLLATIFAVCALEFWAMTGESIIFGIVFNFAKLLCIYLLLCILKTKCLVWYGFVILFVIATACTFSDQVKTKFKWCCDKVLKIIRKDQMSPPTDSTTPDRAPAPPI